MTATINASTTAGVVTTADTSGILQLQTNGTAALTVDASQNVGIGTSSGSARLNVNGGTSTSQIRWEVNNAAFTQEVSTNAAASAYVYKSNDASYHVWKLSSAEAMRIDSSGNVGIGTSSPLTKLHLQDNAAVFIQMTDSADGASRIGQNGTALTFGVDGANGATERARIDSSGNLLVGTTSTISVSGVAGTNAISTATSNAWALSLRHSNASLPWGIAVQYSGASPNNTSQNFYWATDSGDTMRFSVRSNGGIANYSGNNVNLSDRREKTNFTPATSYLDKICAIPVQTFNYIDQNLEEDGGLTLGVIAQDVQAVAPEMVMESNWGTEEEPKIRLSIYQTDLQYALMKCIQEQQALITQLQADVAALKGTA